MINADDIETYQLQRHFEIIIDFIHTMRNENRNVLVHCFAGISRSATGLIVYMIKELGFTF
jgi:protein-tyrosine phosphatase